MVTNSPYNAWDVSSTPGGGTKIMPQLRPNTAKQIKVMRSKTRLKTRTVVTSAEMLIG